MKIQSPLQYADKHQDNLSEQAFKKYTAYLNRKLKTVSMKATCKKMITETDSEFTIIDEFFPIHNIEILDDGFVINDFCFQKYGHEEFEKFDDWFKVEVMFYIRSKEETIKSDNRKYLRLKNYREIHSM